MIDRNSSWSKLFVQGQERLCFPHSITKQTFCCFLNSYFRSYNLYSAYFVLRHWSTCRVLTAANGNCRYFQCNCQASQLLFQHSASFKQKEKGTSASQGTKVKVLLKIEIFMNNGTCFGLILFLLCLMWVQFPYPEAKLNARMLQLPLRLIKFY